MARNYTEDEITEKVRQLIGADFLGYNDAKNLGGCSRDGVRFDVFYMLFGDYSTLGNKTHV